MRGKVSSSFMPGSTKRITPAYAGKRKNMKILVVETQDHPRLCGEKHNISAKLGLIQGSPPPMRGKVSFTTLLTLFIGITPAYAGKSSLWLA